MNKDQRTRTTNIQSNELDQAPKNAINKYHNTLVQMSSEINEAFDKIGTFDYEEDMVLEDYFADDIFPSLPMRHLRDLKTGESVSYLLGKSKYTAKSRENTPINAPLIGDEILYKVIGETYYPISQNLSGIKVGDTGIFVVIERVQNEKFPNLKSFSVSLHLIYKPDTGHAALCKGFVHHKKLQGDDITKIGEYVDPEYT